MKSKWISRSILFCTAVLVAGSAYVLAQGAWPTGNKQENNLPVSDPWKVLQAINRYFETDSIIRQTCRIKLYDGDQSSTILEQYDCLYYGSANQTYMRIGPSETYFDTEVIITADKENKLINLMAAQPGMNSRVLPGLKELKKIVEELKGDLGIIVEGGREVLSFKSDLDADVKSYRFYYDPLTWRIEKIKMEIWKDDAYLQENPRPMLMELDFSPIYKLDRFPVEFGKSRFIKNIGNSVELQNEYEGFEWIDNPNSTLSNQ